MDTHRHTNQIPDDWKDAFQRTPKAIHAAMEKQSAKIFAAEGSADVASNDVFNDFQGWEDSVFWASISKAFDGGKRNKVLDGESLKLEIATSLRSSRLRQNVKVAVILKNELLNVNQDAPKRHIELRLPMDAQYRAGDYIAVLPINSLATVRRVLKHFGLPPDTVIAVRSGENSSTNDTPLSIYNLLSSYVELAQPATRRVSRPRGRSMRLWTIMK